MTALRLGSLFDGIGVFPLAAVRCGIEPIWASEIEKAPISITKRHFPDMAHLGDVTKLDGGISRPSISSPLAHRVKISRRSATARGLREKSPACFFKPSALSVK